MTLLLFLAGLALLILGAELMVRAAVRLAARLHVRPLIIGLTIVALGSSAPQMAVSLQAALTDNPDIAVGSVVGVTAFASDADATTHTNSYSQDDNAGGRFAINAATGELEKGMPIPTVITVFADRSFSFETKTPPATFLIKKAAGLKSGSKEPGKTSAGKIKRSQLAEIAEAKMKDLNANSIEQATKIIEGSARSMGLEVVEG